jgi:3-phenylpropionate/cinnamic acid dioxygenase small subunit
MDLPDPSIITAVQDLYARYAHRIDRRDFDGFAALFTEDGRSATS